MLGPHHVLGLLPMHAALPLTDGIMLVFEKVWGRSFCRTIEKLVEVVQEYPSEVEHIYSPSCVPLVRCAGCCGDENLECHPTQTTNVTICERFMRSPSEQGQEYYAKYKPRLLELLTEATLSLVFYRCQIPRR
uniref:Placental growth factor b n=1 Tax=Neolamprologus brichardi TaxID=32507 RepID=A0A3Q4GE75_NEOBR